MAQKILAFCTLLFFFNVTVNAQYLEFVENKGQWNNAVKYKGQLPFGAFFLQPQGYKMVLHHPTDLAEISEFYTGHNHSKAGNEKLPPAHSIEEKDLQLRSHAYQVTFLNSNTKPSILPEKKLAKYNNYFIGADTATWAGGCSIYQAIVYQNIYPNIDVRYYTNNNQLKYDFIVKPGGKIADIQLLFDGANVENVKGSLTIKTSVGNVVEAAPYTFEVTEKGRQKLSAAFTVKNNTVTFKVENYDPNNTVIIDPSLVFAAFSGSTTDNWGYSATYDGFGNLYGAGIVFGTGYPRKNGVLNNVFNGGDNSSGEGPTGGYDIGVTKFSPNGTSQIFSTYLGGSSNEQPHSMVVDNSNNLIIAGRTASGNYPTTQPTYGVGGEIDIILTKISGAGTTLLASRKFGGSGDDGVNIRPKYLGNRAAESIRRNYGDDARTEIIADENNNLILASCTRSTNFLTTANALKTGLTNATDLQDGIVLKTNTDLSTILFSTYYGGSGDDACFVLAISPIDKALFVGGSTSSNTLLGAGNTPVISSTFRGGETDGYILKLNADNTLNTTTFLGTTGNDMLYGIQVDKFGNPYAMGTTTGTGANAWPIINSPFNASNNQTQGKQFIVKMQPNLSAFVYSTVFGKGGSSPDISPIAFLVDRCENVYVSGWGGSINTGFGYPNSNSGGLSVVNPTNPGFVGDNNDFYIFVLERNALSQLYGGYYGNRGGVGDHVDGGTSRFDKQGVIYQAVCSCGNAGTGFPTSPGTESSTNNAAGTGNGGECNLAVFKIALELAGVGTGVRSAIDGVSRDTSGCVPLLVNFTDTIAVAKKWIWNFNDGSPDTVTTTPNANHLFTTPGIYTVRLVAIDSATCNIADTAYVTIRVRNDEAFVGFIPEKLPPCDSLRYQFVNTSTPAAGKPFKTNSFIWDFGDGVRIPAGNQTVTHGYTAPGTYDVKLILIDTNYCNAPDSIQQQIRIATATKAQFSTAASGCLPYTASFTNNSLAGQSFKWYFGNGDSSTATNPTYTYMVAGTYLVRLIVIDSNTCNVIDSARTTVTVSPKPTAGFNFTPQPPEANTIITFTNSSIGGNRFEWTFGDGDTLVTLNRDTLVQHQYTSTGNYRACLTVNNQFGCIDSACRNINAIIIPALDVPNAFTPNNDGKNDLVRVRGFGIQKMNWQIYNRWGQIVFQSTDPDKGWNGFYKGVLQPQEVYTYTLDVVFFDGVQTRKTGDITLLR